METVANSRQRRAFRGHIEAFANEGSAGGRAEVHMARYGKIAIPALIEACRDARPLVRLRAAWSLGLIGDEIAFEHMVRMTRDRSRSVRYDAYIALGYLGGTRSLEFLIANDTEGSSAYGLVKMGLTIWQRMVELLQSDEESHILTAAYVLYQLDAERSAEHIRPLFQHPSAKVRADAGERLQDIEDSTSPWGKALANHKQKADRLHREWLERIRHGSLTRSRALGKA